MAWIICILIVLTLLMIGFFTGIEFGFLSANRLSIELKKKQGKPAGKIWAGISENPSKFISSMMLGLLVCVIIFTLLMDDSISLVSYNKDFTTAAWWFPYVDFIKMMIETIFLSLILMIVIPFFRSFFKVNSDSLIHTKIISQLTAFFLRLLSPLSSMLVGASEWILKVVFNIKISSKIEAFNKVDLAHFVHQLENREHGDHEEIEKELFENALLLGEKKIRACLIPRKEIEGVDSSCTISEIRNKFIDTKLSKIIVYNKSIDHIVGYVHHLDLFKKPHTLSEIIHPISAVPESMAATDLLNKFSVERKSIAWVIDEFGGTAGIITLEDILEEIFGEIEDEYDTPTLLIEQKISDTEYVFSGRTELDYIIDKYPSLVFQQSKDTETLSGYIVEKKQSIPKQNDKVIIGKLEFEILQVSDTNIETIKVKVLQ